MVTGQPAVLRLMGSGLRRPRTACRHRRGRGRRVGGAAVTRFRPGDEVFGETLRGSSGATAAPSPSTPPRPRRPWRTSPRSHLRGGRRRADRRPDRAEQPAARRVPPGHGCWSTAPPAVSARSPCSSPRPTARTSPASTTRASWRWCAPSARTTIDYTREDFTRGGRAVGPDLRRPRQPLPRRSAGRWPGGGYVLIGHDAFGATGHRWLGSIPRCSG